MHYLYIFLKRGCISAGPDKPAVADEEVWEAFHARDNATARFYKERR